MPGGSAINKAKDLMISAAVKSRAGAKLERFGNMLDFKIDTSERTIHLSILLKGEQMPIDFSIRDYEIIEENGSQYLKLDSSKIETSREWLTRLVREKMIPERIPLPKQIGLIAGILH
ncbi:MAG: hypothetical protein JO076_02615 [Verrucomicrobia bacterium]|nr:hypothetical protein [Verrucomicrobiota bacterium]